MKPALSSPQRAARRVSALGSAGFQPALSGILPGSTGIVQPPGRSPFSTAGFTFIEILAALLFLGILLPAVLSGINLSARASSMSERSALATQLAENQLGQMVVDGSWNTGNTRGEFAEQKGYRWELNKRDWPMASMSELTLTVFFLVQGREQQVGLTTLASTSTGTGTGSAGAATSTTGGTP